MRAYQICQRINRSGFHLSLPRSFAGTIAEESAGISNTRKCYLRPPWSELSDLEIVV